MKTLVIINGVTGAIGTACLARFSRAQKVTVYGLSRSAAPFTSYLNQDGHLPDAFIICSMGQISSADDCRSFVSVIHRELYDRIVYVHAVGLYPFEIDTDGNIVVTNDEDGDGIDDRVLTLSHHSFIAMVTALRDVHQEIVSIIFGGVADKHRPAVHQSWWKTMEMLKADMKTMVADDPRVHFCLLNISSVICPHELLTRPFVFRDTNANPRFWLMPHEVAGEVVRLAQAHQPQRFAVKDLYHEADYYQRDYFTDEKFTERKKAELGIGM
jgi:hypothetical protein